MRVGLEENKRQKLPRPSAASQRLLCHAPHWRPLGHTAFDRIVILPPSPPPPPPPPLEAPQNARLMMERMSGMRAEQMSGMMAERLQQVGLMTERISGMMAERMSGMLVKLTGGPNGLFPPPQPRQEGRKPQWLLSRCIPMLAVVSTWHPPPPSPANPPLSSVRRRSPLRDPPRSYPGWKQQLL